MFDALYSYSTCIYIVIIVAPKKTSTPAGIPWRREWRHSANSTPLTGDSREEEDTQWRQVITLYTRIILRTFAGSAYYVRSYMK